MSYWESVASRVNVISVVLILIGAGISFGARKLAPRLSKDPEKAVVPLKFVGLGLVVAGALITFL